MVMRPFYAGNYPQRQGQLPAFSDWDVRAIVRAMRKTLIERIDDRLAATGKTAEGASKDAGLARDFIRTIRRRPTTSPRGENIAALAKSLGTTSAYLLGETDDPTEGVSRTVQVVGYVGAGSDVNLFSEGQGPFDEVEAPDDATDRTVAVQVRGDSLGPLLDDFLVFYDDVRAPVTEDQIGRLCVVGLPDGRVLVKKIQAASAPGVYHLLSNAEAPIFDAKIEWAARVTNMRPR